MAKRITKKINSRFNPTLLSGYPVYAYGGPMEMSFQNALLMNQNIANSYKRFGGKLYQGGGMLPYQEIGNLIGNTADDITAANNVGSPYQKKSIVGGAAKGAGTGAAAGAAIGSVVPVIGTAIGAGVGALVGGVAGGIGTNSKNKVARGEYQIDQQEALKQQTISNLPAQHYYQPTFAMGGKISPSEIAKGTKEEMEHTSSKKVSRKTAMDHLKEDPKYYTKLKKAGLADSYAGGGMLNSYANGGNLDNTTVFQGGGSHQENQLGGIPQGTNALVEEGEVRFKDYIFSNRIPYTKKK